MLSRAKAIKAVKAASAEKAGIGSVMIVCL
jgi:hypothetical protein